MIWTTERPDKPGRYRFRGTINAQPVEEIIEVIQMTEGTLVIGKAFLPVASPSILGEWYGPIEMPGT